MRGEERLLDTAKTILLPVSLYEEGRGEDYLRLNGMEPGAGERVVVSEPRKVAGEDVVAVMAVPARELVAKGSGGRRYTSPLLEIARGRKRDVNIRLTAGNVYIVVWEKGLRMAEAMPDPSPDALLYYLQVIGREFKLRKFDINVSGNGAEGEAKAREAVEVLREYFDNVRLVREGE